MLQTRNHVQPPAELTNTTLSDRIWNDKLESYRRFNEACRDELFTMNGNVINNIVSRGGVIGWQIAENGDDLKKSFEFSSFE